MIIERIKSKVVAHLSYFIGSKNEAVVVDPQRTCHVYCDIARLEGMTIKYIFETHRNEDYVIGSKELAFLTGAEIYHGSWPKFNYGSTLKDGQEFKFGNLKVTAIHTPGHTPGDMSYAFTDLDSGEEKVLVCTGDTLFVNDVGRTDFGGVKRREWSEALYNSIHDKLLPLGDHVILCPAHGEGSVCGGDIADREWSTLGIERLINPMLQKSKKMFVDYKTKEHHEYMPYFRTMEKYNVEGAQFVGAIPEPKALTPKEFKEKRDDGSIIIDTRSPIAFAGGHIKFSYNIPMSRLGMIGWFLPCEAPLLLIADNQTNLNYVNKSLLQIGYDNVVGYLKDSLDSWSKIGYPFEHVGLLTVTELKAKLEAEEYWNLLDVRSKKEYEKEHIKGIKNIYVGVLEKHINEIQKDGPLVVICKTGKRSAIASSILLREGYKNVYNLLGGMEAWKTVEHSL